MKGDTHLFSDLWCNSVLKPELSNLSIGMLKWLPKYTGILIAKKFRARLKTFYKVINGKILNDAMIDYLTELFVQSSEYKTIQKLDFKSFYKN
ncbi:hypothetical protein D9V86_00540 [Bacteroidetes/Chlorobi group bacterium ChocPot_Mid]|nr:MAG: hypothetical protein D9V86_00540 [Bacteroidetes/Chlorobi group bacterium ChocPot_Mid]